MKQWMINIILFLLVILAIGISLLNVTPFEITGDTYIGVIVTLMTLAASFVIGYQIYNAIEFKKEIAEQRKLYEAISSKSEEMERKYDEQNNQMQEGFDILSSLIHYNSGQDFIVCGQAFFALHHALVSSINTSRTDYEWIFSCLRTYISAFNWQTFCSGFCTDKDNNHIINTPGQNDRKTLNSVVDDYLVTIKDDEKLLRANPNFCKIQIEYNRVIKIFYDRINSILTEPMKMLTPEEQYEIINPKY